MKREYEEKKSILKIRMAGLEHELHLTTLQKQKHEKEKKTLSFRNDCFRCTIHQLSSEVEELKNALFSAKAERGDEVIIMDTIVHHDAEWMKIKFAYLTK